MAERKYDIIIWGASGFSGALVVDHYAKHYSGSGLKWAVAGRSVGKLQSVCEQAKVKVDCLTANIDNPKSIEDLLSQTKVVIACAGPFCKVGTPIVEACIKVGTHYCDITGEFWWIHDLIQKYHQLAVAKKVLIVPCCGYDSVPSDIGTFFAVNTMKEKHNEEVVRVRNFVGGSNAGLSTGTLQTALISMGNSETKKMSKDLFLLVPKDKKIGDDKDLGPHYHKDEKCYTIPFPMEVINSKIVRRSAGLLNYGSNFTYEECTKTNMVVAFLTMLFTPLFTFIIGLSFIQTLILKLLPVNPSKESMEKNGRVSMRFVTEGSKKTKIQTTFKMTADGYVATGIMAGEAALCIVNNSKEISQVGGILTPASAFGNALVKRLENVGLVLQLEKNKNE